VSARNFEAGRGGLRLACLRAAPDVVTFPVGTFAGLFFLLFFILAIR